ncbi:MAG: choice-of-anchor M domain-containing protein [Corynebacterium sp.]|nr:choice-of-anchor M domain-containing protein [Corynebacterium sp.]
MYRNSIFARKSLGLVTAIITAIVLVAAMLHSAVSHAADGPLILSKGHIDAFYVTVKDGNLSLELKEDVTKINTVHKPEDIILHATDEAFEPQTEQIPFIGKPSYFLPATQRPEIIWPGWETTPISQGGFKSIDIVFDTITGPGQVFIFETNMIALPPVTNSKSYELKSGERINQAYPAHRHVNWAFTEPGEYKMNVHVESNGNKSNDAVYTWQIGDFADTPSSTTETSSSETPVSTQSDEPKESSESSTAPESEPSVKPVVPSEPSEPSEPAQPTTSVEASPSEKPVPTQPSETSTPTSTVQTSSSAAPTPTYVKPKPSERPKPVQPPAPKKPAGINPFVLLLPLVGIGVVPLVIAVVQMFLPQLFPLLKSIPFLKF